MDDNDTNKEFNIYIETNRMMMVPRRIDKYTLYKKLRETRMSVVFSLLEDGYVIKCIPTLYFEQNKDELKFMTEINHPNILSAERSFKIPESNPRFTAILMPRAKKDLLDYLVEYHYLPENVVCKIMCDSLNALYYLHCNGIWHRDIKLENIFVMRETEFGPQTVIADLGFAHKFGNGFFTTVAKGTEPYAAPELLEIDNSPRFGCHFKSSARYCNNIDVFALGVVMYCLLSGRHPYGRKGNYDIQRHMEGNVIFDLPYPYAGNIYNPFDHVSDLAKDLICQMLCPDPYSRPSIEDVMNHSWFDQFEPNAKPTITSVFNQYRNEAEPIIFGETEDV